ncbi:helix-turn-helix domain-containing protein [Streptomyces lydicus]
MHSSVTSIAQYLQDEDRSPTALGLMLAYRLTELREDAGLKAGEAAKLIKVSPGQFSRLESGKRRWKRDDLVAALRAYGVGPEEDHLTLRLLEESGEKEWSASFGSDVLPDWFQLFVGLERAAKVHRFFETRAFPGLLQCEPYARAIVEGDAMGDATLVRRRLTLRKQRQEHVFRTGSALWVVLEEGVMGRPFGDEDALRAQLTHLKHLLESNGNVTVQILPTSLGVSRPSASFTHLQFNLEGVSDKVYMEHPAGATYYDEAEDVKRYQETFDRLAGYALDPGLTTGILDKALTLLG